MNKELVKNILDVVKTSTDKRVIVKGLVKLRTDLVVDRDGVALFREAGGVSPMVRFLHKPHEQILEVALSILGNCCTDDACCKEAFSCNIPPSLVTILKSIPNSIIQCRSCRLLGNLAKYDRTQLLGSYCPAIAQSISQIIKETDDSQTRMMAYRACRFLLGDPQFFKHFVQASGFSTLLRTLSTVMENEAKEDLLQEQKSVPCLGLKDNQHREKYFEEVARHLEGVRSDIFDHELLKNSTVSSNKYAMPKEQKDLDLICEILKCLLVMSELHMNFSLWESLKLSGCTFAPIVYFTSEENKHRSVALKILSNLSKNPGAFYFLSSADAIIAACELLVVGSRAHPLTESETRHCVNIICTLSSDSCNRSKIRRSGAIRKLITMVKESRSQTEISSILYLLNNFQYDNISMELMLREGLINVLIKELNVYLTSDDEYHKRKREEKQKTAKKRKFEQSTSTELGSPVSSTVDFGCKYAKIVDYESPNSSPNSYISPSSPCSSRSMSPLGSIGFKSDIADDLDDETYSPVCSDDEEEEPTPSNENTNNVDATTVEHSDVMKLLDIACQSEPIEENALDKEDDDDTSQDVPTTKLAQLGNFPKSTIDIIENLLFRSTLLINKRPELGKSDTLFTLVKALNVFGTNNNFSGSLTNILLESQFFAQVIKLGIVHQLYQLTKNVDMIGAGFGFIETLSCVGESNYGKAELARFLRCDDLTLQKRAAIAVGYIIKGPRLLYQFLYDGNALTILLNIILSNKEDELTAEAVDALTSMAKNTLLISVPNTKPNSKDDDDLDEYLESDTPALCSSCDMRFVVHENKERGEKEKEQMKDPVIVEFSKNMLCSTSEVFNTMLNSDFREGNEGEIHLQSYSVGGLKYFLNLIVRTMQQKKLNVPPVAKYNSILEAFEMSRIYIIPAMEEFTQQLLVQHIDERNCLSLLEWSIRNYHAELTEIAINYFLCSTLSTDAKVKLFRSADYSEYSTQWLQMMYEAIYVRCRNGTY